jgi:hypothetical protein
LELYTTMSGILFRYYVPTSVQRTQMMAQAEEKGNGQSEISRRGKRGVYRGGEGVARFIGRLHAFQIQQSGGKWHKVGSEGRMAKLDAKIAHKVAHSLDTQMKRKDLRALCDEETQWTLTQWELEKLTSWVEEHPAYNALPDPEDPLSP